METTSETPKKFIQTPVDTRLDRLYLKSIRCPYCHTQMPKGTPSCENCGITKAQLYHAKLADRHAKHRKLNSTFRPGYIPYWQMVLLGIFGFTGAHCFRTKRWWRGSIILLCTICFLIEFSVFPMDFPDSGITEHPWRQMFREKTYPFPPDAFGWVAFTLWLFDLIAIIFDKFKYPVVLSEDPKGAPR